MKNQANDSMPQIPPIDAPTRWYYADFNNQSVGPVSDEDLQTLYHEGIITLDTLVFSETAGDWQTYHSVYSAGKQLTLIPPMRAQRISQAYSAIKKCPFCAESISPEAKKCKHCGEIIDVALRAATEAKNSKANQPMVFMNAGGAVVNQEKRNFPHGMHLLLTIFTAGGWIVIWVLHYLFRSRSYYK